MKGIVRSMTGYARVGRPTGAGEIVITLKSLNHRGLDLHFHAPAEVDAFEGTLRTTIKKTVLRGHVDIRVAINRPEGYETVGLNDALLRTYLASFRRAASEHGLPNAKPDLNMAFRMPGMFSTPLTEACSGEIEPDLVAALEEALGILNDFRAREGAELAAFILRHNSTIAETCAQVEQIRARAMPLFQQRLTERLKDLLRNSTVDPQRLAQEAALLADRSDIGEEVARLKIHSNQLEKILQAGGETGKKLDFLLQEMSRETNTILSKTNGIGELGMKITELALAAKADIEKIREQALNLE